MNVRFFGGTRAQYDSLPTPRNPLGLYFCTDTNELFWGDRLISDGIRIVPTYNDLPDPKDAADGIVYYIAQTRNGYVVPHGSNKWVQTIYAPVTDAYEVPESEIYNTVTTVGAVRDIEAKIYNTIDERLSEYTVSEVPFNTSKLVTKACGGFNEGDNVQGLTYAQLFTKLLGLVDKGTPSEPNEPEEPDDPVEPESIVESIIDNNTVMYQIDANDLIVEVPFNLITYSSSEALTTNDGQTGFYQVLNDSGKRIEAGYQHFTTSKDPYYIVVLPEALMVTQDGNVELHTWNTMKNEWSTASYVLTNDYAQIVATYRADGINPPNVIEGYQLWADLGMSDPGTSYRFIIKE